VSWGEERERGGKKGGREERMREKRRVKKERT
jgi:hypothetical protein